MTNTNALETNANATFSAVADRAAFTEAAQIVSRAIERRVAEPVLHNARIIPGDNGTAFVTATDLDLEISVRFPAAIDSNFGTTIPGAMLCDLLKKAPACDLVAIADDGEGFANIEFDSVNYRLQSLPVSDFPALEYLPSNATRFELSGADAWKAFDRVFGAVSNEEIRYYLNGVYMHGGESSLDFVATDGHRLYRQTLDVSGLANMAGVIIPKKTVKTFLQLTKAKAMPETVSIECYESKIRFEWETPSGLYVVMTSKHVNGTYPDYQRVIPTHNDKLATFNAQSVVDAVAAVSVISSQRGRAVKMTFDNSECTLEINNPDSGSAESVIPIEYSAEHFEVGYNATYLTELMTLAGKASESGEVVIKFQDAGSPAIFHPEGDETYSLVIMPMRI